MVLHDLLPHAYHSMKAHGGALAHVIAFAIGAAAIFGLQMAFPHEEPAHEDDDMHVETVGTLEVREMPTPAPSGARDEQASDTAAEPMEATIVPAGQSVQTANTRN